MSRSHVLVVVVDGLRATALGAFGNTAYPTPALDRFASESLLFDACYSPGVDLRDIYRSMWKSLHPLRPERIVDVATILPRIADQAGYETTFISDDDSVAALFGGEGFQHQNIVPPPVSDFNETPLPWLYHTFSKAAEAIVRANESDHRHFLWLHSRGLYGRWDAPIELQESLRDEGDPPPVGDIYSPKIVVEKKCDPDTAFQYACAYAAQVRLLDECWNGLCETLHCRHGSKWFVLLIGARGFPLGEHGRIGGVDERLCVEQLHVPLLVRFPDGCGQLVRLPELVSHVDVGSTLAEWFTESRPQQSTGVRDGRSLLSLATFPAVDWRNSLFVRNEHWQSFRTSEWLLRSNTAITAANSGVRRSQLFVQPDDRWEANDVAVRCPDILAELELRADQIADVLSRNHC